VETLAVEMFGLRAAVAAQGHKAHRAHQALAVMVVTELLGLPHLQAQLLRHFP
jgi:hypothetical protein